MRRHKDERAYLAFKARWGEITDNGIAYRYELAGPDGARFELLPVEGRDSTEAVKSAKSYLRTKDDVVGPIRVTWRKVYPIAESDGAGDVVTTGEKRPAFAGEWFVSGAIPEGHYAPKDQLWNGTDHPIARRVEVGPEGSSGNAE